MAESIKYKKPDTYHDAGNVYDCTQGKTQEEINASMTPTDEVSFTEQGYTVTYCKSGNVATVIAYRNETPTSTVDISLTQKLPFKPYLSTHLAFSAYAVGSGFLQISESGSIRIYHVMNTGWYRCVATFIAKDI